MNPDPACSTCAVTPAPHYLAQAGADWLVEDWFCDDCWETWVASVDEQMKQALLHWCASLPTEH